MCLSATVDKCYIHVQSRETCKKRLPLVAGRTSAWWNVLYSLLIFLTFLLPGHDITVMSSGPSDGSVGPQGSDVNHILTAVYSRPARPGPARPVYLPYDVFGLSREQTSGAATGQPEAAVLQMLQNLQVLVLDRSFPSEWAASVSIAMGGRVLSLSSEP